MSGCIDLTLTRYIWVFQPGTYPRVLYVHEFFSIGSLSSLQIEMFSVLNLPSCLYMLLRYLSSVRVEIPDFAIASGGLPKRQQSLQAFLQILRARFDDTVPSLGLMWSQCFTSPHAVRRSASVFSLLSKDRKQWPRNINNFT